MSYYTDSVAHGLDDYYAGRGESAGTWVGAGSAAAGVEGAVEAEQLRRLFEGSHPVSGESLGSAYVVREGADRVTGWDLTFSAPKSVSTLWAVGGGTVGMEVRESHDAAVLAALAYLEEHAAFSRTGKAGIRQVDTDGLVAAAFVHRTSRAGDPQLHTHVLVSGRVRCTHDGVWRALDSRGLHRQLKPAGMLYQAALRAELTARLGVDWTAVDRHGQAELQGVPGELRRAYSTRRVEVEGRAAERIAGLEVELGRSLTPQERRRQFEIAVLATRTAKEVGDGSDDGLHDRWRAEAKGLGHPPEGWAEEVVGRSLPSPASGLEEVITDVLTDLSSTSSTFRRADVVRQVTRRAPASAGDADTVRQWVETTATAVLDQAGVIRLTPPDLGTPEELRRRDGQSVFDSHAAARFSTETTLATEQHALDTVLAGRDAGRAVANRAAVEAAVAEFGLGEDQADAVRQVAGGGDGVVCMVGPAGTGKSRAVGAAARAWEDSGIPVRGLALSAVAAGVLRSEADIPSDTVAKFLFEQHRPEGPGPAWVLQPGGVVVVDEAGMVATRDLATLINLTDRAGVKLVLVGDHAQLGAVEAGGLFRLLAADTTPAELSEVRRFQHPWEAAASLQLRDRNPAALVTYEEKGRIIGGDRLAVVDEAFTRWQHTRHTGESVVVLAADHDTVNTLAMRARAALVQQGEVEPDGIRLGEQAVGVGDEIVTLRNDRRLFTTYGGWVRNGDRWRIDGRHEDGSLTVSDLTVSGESGRGRVHLPADYVNEHVVLGYALTIHKAQGVTVDHGIVVANERLSAEALYVAMTRGRHDNTALVITDHLDPEHHDPHAPASPAQVLAGVLAHPGTELAALEHLRETLERSESLAVLAPRLANIDSWIAEHTPPDRSADLARAKTRLEHANRHCKPGLLTRAGRDDRRRIERLTDTRTELAEAEDHRKNWLDEHAETLTYRTELAGQIEARRAELGADAARHQPAHLVDLLGPRPTDNTHAADRWITAATRVEAYREEWGVEPDQLTERPADHLQARQWQLAVGVTLQQQRIEARLAARELDLSVQQSRGIEL